MTKRWKITDIVRASLGEYRANWIRDELVHYHAKTLDNRAVIETIFHDFNVTIPMACGIEEYKWALMTYEERCDALVETARRLNVPMNG